MHCDSWTMPSPINHFLDFHMLLTYFSYFSKISFICMYVHVYLYIYYICVYVYIYTYICNFDLFSPIIFSFPTILFLPNKSYSYFLVFICSPLLWTRFACMSIGRGLFPLSRATYLWLQWRVLLFSPTTINCPLFLSEGCGLWAPPLTK